MFVVSGTMMMKLDVQAEYTVLETQEEHDEYARSMGYADWNDMMAHATPGDPLAGTTGSTSSEEARALDAAIADYQTWLSVNYAIPGLITEAQYNAIMDNLKSGAITFEQAYADPTAYATTQKATITTNPTTGESTVTKKEEPVSATAKVPTEKVIIEPTCTNDGELEITDVNDKVTYEVIPAMGHECEIKIIKEATCEVAGLRELECVVCGEIMEEEIPALTHQYEVTNETKATYTQAGNKTFTCNVCGDTYEEEVAMLQHELGEWEISKEATLFTKGEMIQKSLSTGEVLFVKEISQKIPTTVLVIGAATILCGLVVVIGVVISRKRKIHERTDKSKSGFELK